MTKPSPSGFQSRARANEMAPDQRAVPDRGVALAVDSRCRMRVHVDDAWNAASDGAFFASLAGAMPVECRHRSGNGCGSHVAESAVAMPMLHDVRSGECA